jgi:two-component system, NtrC family, response regulator PilR
MATDTVLTDRRVLVVDDEPDLRTLYELTLLREGYRVETAHDLQEASALLDANRYEVLITDMRLPDGLGISLIHRLKAQQRAERCIVITAYGSAQNAVESLKAGAFDYLTKPVDLKQFRAVVASALQNTAPPHAIHLAGDTPPQRPASSGELSQPSPPVLAAGEASLQRLAGHSVAITQVKERIVKVARSMAPVLIRGESGTGKELVAQALHANSHRAQGPWVAVNCSAIPEQLLEAEFFGARKGAYTGSTHDRPGFFQAAHGGTLFLDEIGDLPLAMQSKLLRAIQERVVRPIGSSQEEPVDVRIISATHKDLQADVARGVFRQDLFYRLNVIDMHLPPLRERQEDLPALCQALLQRIAQESGMPPAQVSDRALAQLQHMLLPGNVRELENLLHRALALSDSDILELDETPSSAPSLTHVSNASHTSSNNETPRLPTDLQSHLDQQEREILIKTLQETQFNRTEAANRLGLTLRQIRYRIARLQIEMPSHADDAPAP